MANQTQQLAARASSPASCQSDESEKVGNNKTKTSERKTRTRRQECVQHGGAQSSVSFQTQRAVTASIMAAVSASSRAVGALPDGLSERSDRVPVPVPGGGGKPAENWKRDIVRQLKHRDVRQHAMFQDLIRFCTTLQTVHTG